MKSTIPNWTGNILYSPLKNMNANYDTQKSDIIKKRFELSFNG